MFIFVFCSHHGKTWTDILGRLWLVKRFNGFIKVSPVFSFLQHISLWHSGSLPRPINLLNELMHCDDILYLKQIAYICNHASIRCIPHRGIFFYDVSLSLTNFKQHECRKENSFGVKEDVWSAVRQIKLEVSLGSDESSCLLRLLFLCQRTHHQERNDAGIQGDWKGRQDSAVYWSWKYTAVHQRNSNPLWIFGPRRTLKLSRHRGPPSLFREWRMSGLLLTPTCFSNTPGLVWEGWMCLWQIYHRRIWTLKEQEGESWFGGWYEAERFIQLHSHIWMRRSVWQRYIVVLHAETRHQVFIITCRRFESWKGCDVVSATSLSVWSVQSFPTCVILSLNTLHTLRHPDHKVFGAEGVPLSTT